MLKTKILAFSLIIRYDFFWLLDKILFSISLYRMIKESPTMLLQNQDRRRRQFPISLHCVHKLLPSPQQIRKSYSRTSPHAYRNWLPLLKVLYVKRQLLAKLFLPLHLLLVFSLLGLKLIAV